MTAAAAGRRAACSRADLARALAALGPEGLAATAHLLGLEHVADRAPGPSQDQGAAGGGEPSPASRPAEPAYRFTDVPFWIVERFEPAEQPATGGRGEDEEVSEASTNLGTGSAPRPVPFTVPPLLPWPRLWSWLRRVLVEPAEHAEPDVSRLVDLLSRGERVTRMPRRRRPAAAARVWLLVDRGNRLMPFWQDQDRLGAALERQLGRLGVEQWVVLDQPDGVVLGRRGATRRPRVAPPLHTPVLLLGDLGAYGEAEDRAGWLRSARRLRREGRRLHALVPCPPARVPRDSAAAWGAHTWDRAAGAPDDPPAAAARRRRAERLLRLLAPAVRVEPGLLRAARLLLPPGKADVGTEADAWQHASADGALATALALDPDAARAWRAAWEQEPEGLRRAVVDAIRRVHDALPPEIGHEETLTLAHLDRRMVEPAELAAARRFFRALLARIENAQDAEAAIPGIGSYLGRLDRRSWADAGTDPVVGKQLRTMARRLLGAAAAVPRHWQVCQDRRGLRIVPTAPGAMTEPARSSLVALVRVESPELRIIHPRGAPIRIQLARESSQDIAVEPVALESDAGRWHVTTTAKPAWASGMGRDRFGLWADAEIKGVRQRFRFIPPGPFRMGSPLTEAGRWDAERLHDVVLTRGYWLAETPCPQTLWQAVMEKNPSRFRSPDRPVESVSWDDVQRFLDRVNRDHAGLSLRLPTEAEWERACRAGTETSTYVGDAELVGENNAPLLDEIAWYGGNSGVEFELPEGADSTGWREKQYDHVKAGTHPVALKRPNAFGLFDMLGNVWEWCADWFAKFEADVVVDPTGPTAGAGRVVRGGSWFFHARYVRSADRGWFVPADRYDYVGFRLARGQGDPPAPRSGKPGADSGRGVARRGTRRDRRGPDRDRGA